MYIYFIISSIYLSFLIYKQCTKKTEEYDYGFPADHYISRIEILRFLGKPTNFEKLDKIFNNNIYKKMIDVVIFNDQINNEYIFIKSILGEKVINFNDGINLPIEINGKVFNTSIPNLNFIRWFIINDYFLYIEKIEN